MKRSIDRSIGQKRRELTGVLSLEEEEEEDVLTPPSAMALSSTLATLSSGAVWTPNVGAALADPSIPNMVRASSTVKCCARDRLDVIMTLECDGYG